jgi:diguanylate cyclase (GGDEF)-like protein/PAS domain S-box-containing protein
MKIGRIRYKLLLTLAIALSMGFASIGYFYTMAVEKSIMSEYQRTLHRLTDSVAMNVETIMKERHAEIMPDFSRRLKVLPGVLDFRIARLDGTEAFLDNKTIDSVNQRLGESSFDRRATDVVAPKVFSLNDPGVSRALGGEEGILVQNTSDPALRDVVTFYDPILHSAKCDRCHAAGGPVRAVLKLTTSIAEVERDMMKARLQSLIVVVVSLALTMAITGYMLGRFIAKPIEEITAAMGHVSGGKFDTQVASSRKDELGHMARSFNKMTTNLLTNFQKMKSEKEKLHSVVQGAQEAIVVTDDTGKVVLVNDATELLIGKSVARIQEEGLLNLLDEPERFQSMLDDTHAVCEPSLFEYKGRWLLTSAHTIRDTNGITIGSAALLRDVTLEQAMLKELERLSITDALTDVFNRRHLDATLKTEIKRAHDVGSPLAVIMFDADHFKKFNDTYGHDQGDRVLKMVGQVMQETVRKYDVPCRYGGEEFTVILPSTDAEGAMHFAERLRKNIEAMRVDGLQVTVSLGVACFPQIPAETPEALIEAADTALYVSKESGRNCSTMATAAILDKGKNAT